MSDQMEPIFCSKCQVESIGRINENGKPIVTCPICNRADSFEDAVGEAGKHFIDKQTRKMLSSLPGMTFKAAPQQIYLWRFGKSD
jgi:hypothetical protein